jgi:hypothetical protein
MRRAAVAVFAFVFALGLSAGPVSAFDTGPHASITEDVMRSLGFSGSAADATQVENWLTDYYTSTPTIGSGPQCMLEKLHFDDVFSTSAIRNYWANLTANTKVAAKKAESDNDVVEFLTVMGMSLHVVQDFYSHSNWVEQRGVDPNRYKTKTWFEESSPSGSLVTGWYDNCLHIPQGGHTPHGGYTSGLNHDSVVRPRYANAYVYAYAGSEEWARNVLSWVSTNFANKVKAYSPSSSDAKDLAYDQEASIYISEWIQNPLNKANLDGHWNGNRSGYAAAFAVFAAKWTGSHNSVYVKTFKDRKVYEELSKNLYTSTTALQPAMSQYPTSGTVLAMRTLSVYANSAITGTDSYFGTLGSNNAGRKHWYRDASQYHLPRTSVPWLQLMIVPASESQIPFSYSLWNEWNTTNNDMVPIQSGKKTLNFTCKTKNAACTGDINGGPWTLSSPYTTTGSGSSGVRVQLYFMTTPANP